jgi:hypothetical protein
MTSHHTGIGYWPCVCSSEISNPSKLENKKCVAQVRMGKVRELLAGNGIKIGHSDEAICL